MKPVLLRYSFVGLNIPLTNVKSTPGRDMVITAGDSNKVETGAGDGARSLSSSSADVCFGRDFVNVTGTGNEVKTGKSGLFASSAHK